MGAGSVAADNADKELQDTGLVFGAVYTVLRVVEIEGNQLIQLRNPPGKYNNIQKKGNGERCITYYGKSL